MATGVTKKKSKKNSSGHSTYAFLQPWLPYAALIIILLSFGMIRVRLLDFPLERDEGEYAYAGQLIQHAIFPSQLCYTMKLPGTAAAYALFTAIFGETPAGAHLGLLAVNSATIVLMFFLARRLFGALAGVVASASFALLSIEPAVLGIAGHATQFVVLPAVGGVLLLLKAIDSDRVWLLFWSGTALGAAFLMKQPGLFFVLFGIYFLAYSELRRASGWRDLQWKRLVWRMGALLAGAAAPFALVCLFALAAGAFHRFWFWAFSYASQYGTIVSLSAGLQFLWATGSTVLRPALFIWLIAATGTAAILWSANARRDVALVFGFFVFSFAAVASGLYFRSHYFVMMLPAASLLCAAAVSIATGMLRKHVRGRGWAIVPSLVFLIAMGMAIDRDGEFFFETDPVAACRELYGRNPFPEALEVANYIREHSSAEDRVAVVGSEPEIYFYAQRQSATGYIYTYPLMESQPFAADMQREMQYEIESGNPRFLVCVDVRLSWLPGPTSDQSILTWSEKYARQHYQLVGVVDLLDQETEIRWDADARNYEPRSESKVLVFERLG